MTGQVAEPRIGLCSWARFLCLVCAAAGCQQSRESVNTVLIEPKCLETGERVPLLEAQGWINGSMPQLNANTDRVTVIDLWADS